MHVLVCEDDDLIASGKMTDTIFRFEGVTAIDDHTLEVRLHTPLRYFPCCPTPR